MAKVADQGIVLCFYYSADKERGLNLQFSVQNLVITSVSEYSVR